MADANENALNPSALTVEQLARLLTRAGDARITEAMLEADLADGAPRNMDGTVNLLHYAAWLTKMRMSSD